MMKATLPITLLLTVIICSPNRVLDEWQARFRAELLASIEDYLPTSPQSAEARAALREIYALPDSAYRKSL